MTVLFSPSCDSHINRVFGCMLREIQRSPSELPANEASRVAKLLAIDGPESLSEVQLARRVSRGLPPESVLGLSEALGRKWIVGPIVPEASLRRARNSNRPLSRELSERMYEMGQIVDALRMAYRGNHDAINNFLHRPHVLLKGDTPFDLARSSSAGAQAVLNLIRRAEAGVPA